MFIKELIMTLLLIFSGVSVGGLMLLKQVNLFVTYELARAHLYRNDLTFCDFPKFLKLRGSFSMYMTCDFKGSAFSEIRYETQVISKSKIQLNQ
jgi:hypothetical protein